MRIEDVSGSGTYIVVRGHVGWLIRYKDATVLVTSRGDVVVDEREACRKAMSRDEAAKRLTALATAGNTERPDELTRFEIGAAMHMSQRMLARIIARGTGSIDRIDGPEDVWQHEYMGAFDVEDELVIADPCYVAETRPLLACSTKALPGRWHAYIRFQGDATRDISIAMFAVHDQHLARAYDNGEELGLFGVDSGSVLIVDARARARAAAFKEEREWREGLVEDDLGCFAWTAAGDGVYPARAVHCDGRAVVVRASLAGANEAYFQAPPPPKAPPTKAYTKAVNEQLAQAGQARAYSPKLRFAPGDRVTHPTFGDGVVGELLPDNKVKINFADGPRTLVHARS